MKDLFGWTIESWYYQEIEGKPYAIAVAEGEHLEEGFKSWAHVDYPFAIFFRSRVEKLTGVSVSEAPKGPQTKLIYEFVA